ncbi:MAG: metallophosphoesterase [Propionibacteriaceae bacterium]
MTTSRSPLTRTGRLLGVGALGAVGLGLSCLGYSALYEVDAFRLRRVRVPVLPAGAGELRVLHLSDLHLTPYQQEKQAWVSRLAALEPDLVINTGDNLGHRDALPYLVRCLGRLLDVPGVFVFGSNDYYGPRMKNPLRYLSDPLRHGKPAPDRASDLPWEAMRDRFTAAGWVDLNNERARLEVKGLSIDLRGTDDAHLKRDDYASVAGPADAAADLRLGVTHAPYSRVLDPMTADGMNLIMAGHTHGGQVCVPGYGALITNCDLDTARVKGLSQHVAGERMSALHVSAGLGTSPTSPIRFACPPEATLLTLAPATD